MGVNMVVITWLEQNCAMVRGRLHEEPMADVKYIVGDKPPNYPVPALREYDPSFYHPQSLVDYAKTLASPGYRARMMYGG